MIFICISRGHSFVLWLKSRKYTSKINNNRISQLRQVRATVPKPLTPDGEKEEVRHSWTHQDVFDLHSHCDCLRKVVRMNEARLRVYSAQSIKGVKTKGWLLGPSLVAFRFSISSCLSFLVRQHSFEGPFPCHVVKYFHAIVYWYTFRVLWFAWCLFYVSHHLNFLNTVREDEIFIFFFCPLFLFLTWRNIL